MRDPSPIVLVGFMATGKSTVGRLLAARTGRRFVDLDELVEAEAGMSVTEIFRSAGEAGFRRMETGALARALGMADVVVATGGGAACREDNLAAMLARGTVVALSATPAEVLRRAGSGSGRPLLDHGADRLAAARRLLAEREPFYARAHHRIDTVGKTPEAVAAEALRMMGGPERTTEASEDP